MEMNPHALVEGCIIGCYGIGAHAAYIYVRDELHLSKERLVERHQGSARARATSARRPFGSGLPGRGLRAHRRRRVHLRRRDVAPQLARGASAASRGSSRRSRAQYGAFGCPTTVNNVETIAIVPTVFEMGGDEFSEALGAPLLQRRRRAPLRRERSREEAPASTSARSGLTLRELIYDLGGGVLSDRKLLGVIPGGSSCPVHLPGRDRQRPERPALRALQRQEHPRPAARRGHVPQRSGTMLGTCCAIVLSGRGGPGAGPAQPDALLPPRVVRPVHARAARAAAGSSAS